MTGNLFNTDQNNGNRTFGGEIDTTKKGTILIFEEWEHALINNEIPIGINMLLVRNMEKFLEIPRTNINARYRKH